MDTTHYRIEGNEMVEYNPHQIVPYSPPSKTKKASSKNALAKKAKQTIAKQAKKSKASVTLAVKKARENLKKVVQKVSPKKPKTVVEQLFFM